MIVWNQDILLKHKNQVNIRFELMPHNPLLTYHQHLCIRRLKHVPFVSLILLFFVYVGQVGAECCSPAIPMSSL